MSLKQCIIKIKEGLRVKQVDGKEVIKIQGVPEVPQSAQKYPNCSKVSKSPKSSWYCPLLPKIALCLLKIRDCLREIQVDGHMSQKCLKVPKSFHKKVLKQPKVPRVPKLKKNYQELFGTPCSKRDIGVFQLLSSLSVSLKLCVVEPLGLLFGWHRVSPLCRVEWVVYVALSPLWQVSELPIRDLTWRNPWYQPQPPVAKLDHKMLTHPHLIKYYMK